METPSRSPALLSLGLVTAAFLAFSPGADAGPADAVQSAIQSHIQSIRDDIWYRTRRMNDAGISYCMRRFRSYDPYTMTYMGYDGRRRRCP